MISRRVQDAFKLALALVIAAGTSLVLGWDNPKWAMFAVAFSFLATGGETLAKGLMRLAGTLIGIVLALSFLALFAQDRWAYAASVSLWLFICGWFIAGGSRIWYMWFVGGFMVILLVEYSQFDARTAFDVAVLRMQQTALGILIYTLVESLIFSNPAKEAFKSDLLAQIGRVRQGFGVLTAGFRGEIGPAECRDEARKLGQSGIELQKMLTARLDGATVESFDVLERREAWRQAVTVLAGLIDAFAHWRLGFADLHDGGAHPPPPGLEPVLQEIDRRLAAAGALLAGCTSFTPPRQVAIPQVTEAGDGGDPFHQGALAVSLMALAEIERASRGLLLAVADGQGLSGKGIRGGARAAARSSLIPATILPDPERFAGALRVSVSFLLSFLIFVWFPDIPAASMLLILSTNIALIVSRAPATPIGIVAKIGMVMILLGAALHIFVMPHLTSFAQLAVMIFVVSFAITYMFHDPKVAIGRTLGLAMMIVLMQLENRQSYSFLYAANLATAFLVPFGIVWLTGIFPVSFRPEDAFRRLLRRYMRACLALLETMTGDRPVPAGWWQRQIRAWNLRLIQTIPQQMTPWLNAMPDAALPGEGRARAQELLEALQALSHRIEDLFLLSRAGAGRRRHRELMPGLREWCDGVAAICRALRDDPQSLSRPDSAIGPVRLTRLRDLAASLVLRNAGATQGDGPQDGRDLLRELTALRGVGEAVSGLLPLARGVDWDRMQEARF